MTKPKFNHNEILCRHAFPTETTTIQVGPERAETDTPRTRYQSDADDLFDVFNTVVPNGTINRFMLRMLKAEIDAYAGRKPVDVADERLIFNHERKLRDAYGVFLEKCGE